MMPLAGRQVEFKRAGVGQVIMLQRRAVKKIRAADQIEKTSERIDLTTTALVEVFDFIDTLIVSPDDRQFVEDNLLSGKIAWEELVAALGGAPADKGADDEAPKPVKKAPKKSPKAATAAKTVATRGRAKR